MCAEDAQAQNWMLPYNSVAIPFGRNSSDQQYKAIVFLVHIVSVLLLLTSTPAQITKLSSAEITLDGKFLWACHSGADLEQLCISETPSDLTSIFFLNTTSIGSTVSKFLTGALVYNLAYGEEDNKQVASSALRFAWNPVSNIISSYFQPVDEGSEIASFGLDADNKLFVPAYVDDVITPNGPQLFTSGRSATLTQFMGYKYQALVWLTVGDPLDGGCQAVNFTAVPPSGA